MMNKLKFVAALALLGLPQISAGQVWGGKTTAGCVSSAKIDARVTLVGRLIVGSFTDDYGKERVYLLQVPASTCIDDGGEFADPTVRFAQVQLAGRNSKIEGELRISVGRKIKVSGNAFAAHTRHHHRPMVVIVDRVRIAGR